MRGNVLDRAVAWLAPERGLRRLEARARAEGLVAARALYEGATTGRRAQGWRVVATDANAETRGQAARLRDVARDMVRNNPHAARAVQVITQNVVGAHITPSAVSDVPRARDELEALLKAHFDTTACDALGRHDLYGLQALVMRTVVEAGEAIVRLRPRRREDGLPLPFQLQVMEPDHIDSSVDGPQPGGTIAVQGIEFYRIRGVVACGLDLSVAGSSTFHTLPQRPSPAR